MEMVDTKPSLYRLLATAPPAACVTPVPGPGTIETNAIETIDNDRAVSLLAAIGDARNEGSDSLGPGTVWTATPETTDNDTGAITFHSMGWGAW